MKTVYVLNQAGVHFGQISLGDADISPLEPGVYLVPAGCVEEAPPPYSQSEFAQWSGGVWTVQPIPTPDPTPIAPPPPIAPISPRQIRMALTRAGLRASVEAAVAAGNQDLKDWYEFSTAFERLNPQVIGMGLALGVTAQQLDDLWALGATL